MGRGDRPCIALADDGLEEAATMSKRAALQVIAVGRLRSGPEAALFAHYGAHLRPPLGLVEVAEARGAPGEIRRREAASLLGALPPQAFVVALDLGGAAPDSEGLAAMLERWLALSRPVCFLIGGAEGLDAAVLARADHVLSLGPLTWPHFLARAMLAEQLFRARAIAAGHPYHRAARPVGSDRAKQPR
jgi:23S rRNA (pseudouridine1915-N3)-methyltransferase